jgi:predicted nuclease of restriction endonuclease-like (RecB) superfamily
VVTSRRTPAPPAPVAYGVLRDDVALLIEHARQQSARAVNSVMTATYWLVGRRIVEFEQQGQTRAGYGERLIERLSADLTSRFGRGFSGTNLKQFRSFFLSHTRPADAVEKGRTPPDRSPAPLLHPSEAPAKGQTLSDLSVVTHLAEAFRLPWSAYVRLLSVRNEQARRFYEEEALRGGWTVRQLERQIDSMFYERTALSRDKAALLRQGGRRQHADEVLADEAVKDPYVLEFLGLRDEYSETELEAALIHHLERFLLELGGDFAFVGRQRRLRIGNQWFRIDLLFFHRRLRCLVVIDLKTGRFTHADAGQMHVYLNYARERWTLPGENPPVGLILCAEKNAAVAHYALENLPNKVLAAEYRMTLPAEGVVAQELRKMRLKLESDRGPRTRTHLSSTKHD